MTTTAAVDTGSGKDSTDKDSDDGGVNLGMAVGIPVAIVIFLLLCALIVFVVWKWKYKRKYSMNGSATPEKYLTSHEDSMKKSSPPPLSSSFKNGSLKKRPEILLRTPSREAELYVVRHVFQAQEPSHLTLQMGRIVEVVERSENGWWRGLIDDEEGWFPGTFVKKIDATENKRHKKREAPKTPDEKSETTPSIGARDEEAAILKRSYPDMEGFSNVALVVENEVDTKEPEMKLPDVEKLDENQIQGYINEIFAVEEGDSPTEEKQLQIEAVPIKPDVIIDANRETVQFSNSGAKPTYCLQSESDINQNVAKSGLDQSEAIKKEIAPIIQETTPTVQPDVTLTCTESFEMKQSFGPESTVEILDETADISLPATVKSDSPASLGAVVGVTSAGAWQRDSGQHNYGAVVISDEYTHNECNIHATEQESPREIPTPKRRLPKHKEPHIGTYSEKEPIPKEKLKLNFDAVVEFQDEIDAKPTQQLRHRPRPKSDVYPTPAVYVAMYTYSALHEEQLSLTPNDVIIASHGNHVNGWVKGRKKDHPEKEGWFPISYVREGTNTNLLQVPGTAEKSLSEPELSDGDFGDHSFEEDLTGMAYRAKYPYTACMEGDLSFIEGDIIVVVDTLDNGWWRGVVDGRSGWFPGSYVDVIPQTPMTNKGAPTWPKAGPVSPASLPCLVNGAESSAIEEAAPASADCSQNADTPRRESWSTSKPDLPKRFVIPKLMTVRGTGELKKRSPDRPARPPPPAPPTGERKAPPRRKSDKTNSLPRKSRTNSLPRPNVPPPQPPPEPEADGDSSRPCGTSPETSPRVVETDIRHSSVSEPDTPRRSDSEPDTSRTQNGESAGEIPENNTPMKDTSVNANMTENMLWSELSPAPVEFQISYNEKPSFHSTPLTRNTGRKLKLDIGAAQKGAAMETSFASSHSASPAKDTSPPVAMETKSTSRKLEYSTRSHSPTKSPSPGVSPENVMAKFPGKARSPGTGPVTGKSPEKTPSPSKSPDKSVQKWPEKPESPSRSPDKLTMKSPEKPPSPEKLAHTPPERPPPQSRSPEKVIMESPLTRTASSQIISEKHSFPDNIPDKLSVKSTENRCGIVSKSSENVTLLNGGPEKDASLSGEKSISPSKSPEKWSHLTEKPAISSKPIAPPRPVPPQRKPKIASPKPQAPVKPSFVIGRDTAGEVLGSSPIPKIISAVGKKTPPPRPTSPLRKSKAPPIPTPTAKEGGSSQAHEQELNFKLENNPEDLLSEIMLSFEDLRLKSEIDLSPSEAERRRDIDITENEVQSQVDLRSPHGSDSEKLPLSSAEVNSGALTDKTERNGENHDADPKTCVNTDEDIALTSTSKLSDSFKFHMIDHEQSLRGNASEGDILNDSQPFNGTAIYALNDSRPFNNTELDIVGPHSPSTSPPADAQSLPTKVRVRRYDIDKPAVIKDSLSDNDAPQSPDRSEHASKSRTSSTSSFNSLREATKARLSNSSESERCFSTSPPICFSDGDTPGFDIEATPPTPSCEQSEEMSEITNNSSAAVSKFISSQEELQQYSPNNSLQETTQNSCVEYGSNLTDFESNTIRGSEDVLESPKSTYEEDAARLSQSTYEHEDNGSLSKSTYEEDAARLSQSTYEHEDNGSFSKSTYEDVARLSQSTYEDEDNQSFSKSTFQLTVPSIEITSTPIPQKMSRGVVASVNQTPSAPESVTTESCEELASLAVSQIDPDRLSLTDLLPDATIRPDTPQSVSSFGEPPPLPSMPPPIEQEDGSLKAVDYPQSCDVTVDSAYEVDVDETKGEGQKSSLTVDSAHEAYVSGLNSGVLAQHSLLSFGNPPEDYISNEHRDTCGVQNGDVLTEKAESEDASSGKKVTDKLRIQGEEKLLHTPLQNKHLLSRGLPYELMATSPYVVIKTPQRSQSVGDVDTHEVSSYSKVSSDSPQSESAESDGKESPNEAPAAKIVPNEAPDSKPLSLAGGFSMHLTSLFDKIFRGDDHINSAEGSHGAHPVNKIKFRRSTPDISAESADDVIRSASEKQVVSRSYSVESKTSASNFHEKSSTFPWKSSPDRNMPSLTSSTDDKTSSPQKPPRRSRSRSFEGAPKTLSPVNGEMRDNAQSELSHTDLKLPVLHPAAWSQTYTKASQPVDVPTVSNGTHDTGDTHDTELSVSNMDSGIISNAGSYKSVSNSMRFFSPSAYVPKHYSSTLTDTDGHVEFTTSNGNGEGYDARAHNPVSHVDAMATHHGDSQRADHWLKDFDTPKPFSSNYGNVHKPESSPGNDSNDSVVLMASYDNEDDVIEL